MFDRRPTADDARFDELLERVLQGERPAGGPAEERDIAMARLLAKGGAAYQEAPTEVMERVWDKARARGAAREAAKPPSRAMLSPRRLATAVVAIALLLGVATPLGRSTVAAAGDAVAAAPEFLSGAVAGTLIEGWGGDTSEPVEIAPANVLLLEDGRIGIPARAVSTSAPVE